MEHKPAIYMSMLETAEIVSKRYGISREAQDEYALQSQQRTAAAQQAGKFDDEIVPFAATMKVQDKATGEISDKEVTLKLDEGNRPETTLEGLQKLKPVFEGGVITAGNASQLSDGASACVVMSADLARERGLHRWACSRALPFTAANPTRWASDRCSPYPDCSSATA